MQHSFPVPQNKNVHPLLEKDLTDKNRILRVSVVQ